MPEAEAFALTQLHERNGRPTVELKVLVGSVKQQAS
jgi:hypothetical protein